MKITFMGTSHGFSEKNQFTAANLIEVSDCYYLLDAGAPVEWCMVNSDKSYDKIRGIFITHMHSDHVSNLSTVISPMLRFRYNDKSVCYFPSEEGKEGFVEWMKVMHTPEEMIRKTVKLGVTEAGEVFKDGNITVLAKPTGHLGDGGPSFAYIFEADGKKVLFTGDMAWNFPEYPEIIGDEHYDLVVCEMAHAKLCDVKEKLKNTDTDRMIITHYYTPQIEGHEEILKSFPFPTEIAKDGMEIVL